MARLVVDRPAAGIHEDRARLHPRKLRGERGLRKKNATTLHEISIHNGSDYNKPSEQRRVSTRVMPPPRRAAP
jgi:hypothetical protein